MPSRKDKKQVHPFEKLKKSQEWHDFYRKQHKKKFDRFKQAENLVKAKYHDAVFETQKDSGRCISWESKQRLYNHHFKNVLDGKDYKTTFSVKNSTAQNKGFNKKNNSLGKVPKDVMLDSEGKPLKSFDGKSYVTEKEFMICQNVINTIAYDDSSYKMTPYEKKICDKVCGGYVY